MNTHLFQSCIALLACTFAAACAEVPGDADETVQENERAADATDVASAESSLLAENITAGWRAYGNTNPITSSSRRWSCGPTRKVDTDVLAQVCAVGSQGGATAQAAVIVRNNRSKLYGAEAAMTLVTAAGGAMGRWECSRSGVGPHSWSVCFGSDFCPAARVKIGEGGVNGQPLGSSPLL